MEGVWHLSLFTNPRKLDLIDSNMIVQDHPVWPSTLPAKNKDKRTLPKSTPFGITI